MAKLSEILSKMNDDVKVQFIHDSAVSVKDKKRTKDTEITIATSEIDCNEFHNGTKTGMVIWFEREDYNRALIEVNSKKTS
jgi:hypothetical protein